MFGKGALFKQNGICKLLKTEIFFIVTDPQKPPWLFLIASILAACGTEFNSGARSALSARAAKPHRYSCS